MPTASSFGESASAQGRSQAAVATLATLRVHAKGAMASGDLIDIVEAAYHVEADDEQWLAGIAAACRSVLDDGFGVCAFQFEHHMGEPPTIVRVTKLGIPDELSRIYASVFG